MNPSFHELTVKKTKFVDFSRLKKKYCCFVFCFFGVFLVGVGLIEVDYTDFHCVNGN